MVPPLESCCVPQLVDLLVFGLMDVDENVRLEAVEAIATAATTRLSLLGEDQHVRFQPTLMPLPLHSLGFALFFLPICRVFLSQLMHLRATQQLKLCQMQNIQKIRAAWPPRLLEER